RPVFPNKITESAETTTIEPWNAYHDAKDRIEDYCNDEGVITKKQSLTESKYLEVFSWESMLKKSNSENDEVFKNFPFARDMQKAGWLDCYCFISAFHYWIHGQYTDFSKKNADRIREYINTQLIK
ncbi:MAG TPA: hypothetical protein VI731_04975, partial [Bacteroidia bacterium]|nr:hypothetical protein [Bacteroidia bacterium]